MAEPQPTCELFAIMNNKNLLCIKMTVINPFCEEKKKYLKNFFPFDKIRLDIFATFCYFNVVNQKMVKLRRQKE